jgi:hypothetical protein
MVHEFEQILDSPQLNVLPFLDVKDKNSIEHSIEPKRNRKAHQEPSLAFGYGFARASGLIHWKTSAHLHDEPTSPQRESKYFVNQERLKCTNDQKKVHPITVRKILHR